MAVKPPPDPTYFDGPDALRRWLEEHHETATELWVGYHRKSTGRPSLTWPEAVDEALCFGWIDGVRYSVDEERFTQRFSPRTRKSTWSAVNIAKARELIAEGRMRPAGLAAFEARADERTAIYSYEQRHAAVLAPDEEATFRANGPAWAWFRSKAPSYRQAAVWWVVSAKRPETRARRLATLIEDSAAGNLVRPLTPRRAGGR
jgi:uncharacterized protein YdeI (YjbR/CyaY-like superfamily)